MNQELMDKIEKYCECELGLSPCEVPAYEILELVEEHNRGEWDYH